MTSSPQDSIQQTVLDKVRAGEVRRRPRAYFIARIVATICVGILLLATAALVISFILFGLHESGEQFLLGFGFGGILTFLLLFPWMPTVGALFLIVVLDWLLRGFRFGYRIPLLPIFLLTVAASVVLGIALNFTSLHPVLLDRAHRNELPVFSEAYSHIFDSHEAQGVYRGSVTSVATSSFVLQHNDWDHDPDDGRFVIFIAPDSGLSLPQPGDRVLVFGSEEEEIIEAKNIQILSQ